MHCPVQGWGLGPPPLPWPCCVTTMPDAGIQQWVLILYRPRRFINHLLTYLLTYMFFFLNLNYRLTASWMKRQRLLDEVLILHCFYFCAVGQIGHSRIIREGLVSNYRCPRGLKVGWNHHREWDIEGCERSHDSRYPWKIMQGVADA